jgi:hypothetical protein
MTMGLILHGVLNAPYPDDPSEMGVVAWVQARGAMRDASAEIARLNGEIQRLKEDRFYVLGCNDGWNAAMADLSSKGDA